MKIWNYWTWITKHITVVFKKNVRWNNLTENQKLKNGMRIQYTSEMAKIQSTSFLVAKIWSNRSVILCWWECKAHMLWKTVGPVSHKTNHTLICNLSISLLGIYTKVENSCPHKNLHANVYGHLFTTVKTWEQPMPFSQ